MVFVLRNVGVSELMSEIPRKLQKMKPPRNTDEHTGAEPQTKKLGASSRLRAFVVKPAPNLTRRSEESPIVFRLAGFPPGK